MTTCTAELKKQGIIGDLKYQIFYCTIVSGDTIITVATDFKRILYHNISPPSVAAKYVTTATVSDGTITYTITNPAAAEYMYVIAISDI